MGRRLRALVTLGGTREPIDDVRAVTNSSTGRLGAAIARALVARGHEVIAVAAADTLRHRWIPAAARVAPFTSFQSLADQLARHADPTIDLVFMVAAVSDYSPVAAEGKRSSDEDAFVLEMTRNPKLLSTLRARCGPDTTLVGFKLLSDVSPERLVAVARAQCLGASLDLTVANDWRTLRDGRHPVWFVTPEDARRHDGDREGAADAIVHAALAVRHGDPAPATALPGRWRRRTRWTTPFRRAPSEGPRRAFGPVRGDRPLVEALARRAPDGLRPLEVHRPDGVELLHADADADADARAFEALARRARDLGARAVDPVVFDGRIVGAIGHAGADALLLDLDDEVSDRWPMAILGDTARPLADRRLVVPSTDAARWAARGFRPDPARDLTPVTAPWDRDDLRAAASIALVDVTRDRVLFGLRRTAPRLAAFPGGRLEPGERPWEGAVRELHEETGVALPEDARPLWTRVVWGGDDPCWHLTAHVVPVLGAPLAAETAEFSPSWTPLHPSLPGSLPREAAPAGVRQLVRDLVEDAFQDDPP